MCKQMTKASVPKCVNCKYYEKGRCRLFVDKYEKKIVYVKTELARLDENMCGPKGSFWASTSDFDQDQIWYSDVPWTRE